MADYLSQLSQSLLDLQRGGILCDVVIEARNGTIYAHSAVLGAASEFMRGLFLEQSECEKKRKSGRSRYRLPLSHCSIAAVTSILHAIYSHTECTVICDKECLRALVDMGFEVPDNIEMAEVSIGGITSLIETLQQMSHEGVLCDVTIQSADGLIKAHSSILAAACPLLKDQLRKEHESADDNTVHNQQYSIDLSSFTYRDIVRNILSIYSGVISDCTSESDVESYNQLNAVGLGIASLGLMEVSADAMKNVAGEEIEPRVKIEETDVLYLDEDNSEDMCSASESAVIEHEEIIEVHNKRRIASRAGAVSKLNGGRRDLSDQALAHEIPGQSLLKSVAGGQTYSGSNAPPVTVIDFQKVKAAHMLTKTPVKHSTGVNRVQHSSSQPYHKPTVSILNRASSSNVNLVHQRTERNSMSLLKRAPYLPVGTSLLAPVHFSQSDSAVRAGINLASAGINKQRNLSTVSSTIVIDKTNLLNKIVQISRPSSGTVRHANVSVTASQAVASEQGDCSVNESQSGPANEELNVDSVMSSHSEGEITTVQSADHNEMKRSCRKRKLSVPVKNSHPASKAVDRNDESCSSQTVTVSSASIKHCINDGDGIGTENNEETDAVKDVNCEVVSEESDNDTKDSLLRQDDGEDESVIMLDMLEEVDPKELEAIIDAGNSSNIVCMLCHKKFECSDALSEHIDDNHHCVRCGKYFRHSAGLRKHTQLQHTGKHERFCSCLICSKNFHSASELDLHLKSHEQNDEKKYSCEKCNESVASATALRSHKRLMHSREAAYVCYICGNKYTYNCNLKTHMSVHSSERPSTCQECGAGFKAHANLLKHLRMCHNMCTRCMDKESCTCTDKNRHVCDVCGKCCNGRMQLEVHRRVHTGEKPEVCGDCGLTFQHRSNLVKHMQKHTVGKTFFCNFCSRGFYNNHSLQSHMRIHTGDSPFQCETCGKRFCTKNGLQVHTILHSDDRPFTCGTCGKSFAQLGNLNKHLAVHTGTRPFKCSSCSMTFVDTSALRRHEVQHTRQRNFSCTVCSRTFLYLTSLRAHKLTHDDVKAHECKICGKAFRQKLGYQRHLKVHEKKSNNQDVVLNPGEYLVYLTE